MKAPHWLGVTFLVLAIALPFGPSVFPGLTGATPFLSVLVPMLVAAGGGILGSLPSWFTKASAEIASKTLVVMTLCIVGAGCLVGLLTAGVGCATLAKDEPVIAADVAKAVDFGCAADAMATDTELAAFASTLIAHPALKDAGPGKTADAEVFPPETSQ
jgi:hypothetical protein